MEDIKSSSTFADILDAVIVLENFILISMMGYDKLKAIFSGSRVAEKYLLLLTVAGE